MNTPPDAAPEPVSYDVFVACCDGDKELAEEQVLLPLRTAGLKAVTRSDGRYGATILDNLENAVTQSRRTLAVITSSYLADPLCQLLDNLTMHLDPAAREARFIPLFFEPKENLGGPGVQPRLLIARLNGVDLSDLTQRTGMMNTLLAQLCGDRKTLNQKSAESARLGVATLRQFLGTAAVQARVEQFLSVFERACEQIELLTHDKLLHDDFHSAQDAFNVVIDRKLDLLEKRAQSTLEAEALDRSWEKVGAAFTNLEARLTTVQSRAAEFAPPGDPPPWIAILLAAEADVTDGVCAQDVELLKAGIEGIAAVLHSEPTRLNGSLKEKARQLPLPDLIKRQGEILADLRASEFDDEARQRIEDFAAGVKALELIEESVNRLISNHDALQISDDQMHVLDHSESPDILRVRQVWRGIAEPLRRLKPSRWIDEFKLPEKMAGLEVALGGFAKAASDPAVARAIRCEFRKLRPAVSEGFSRTDADLKTLCGEISKLRQTADQRLDVISHA